MPSVAGSLADARNRARISPSFKEGGDVGVMPPTGMMRSAEPEEETEEREPYAPPGYTPRTPAVAGGGEPSPRGTMGLHAGGGSLASSPELGAQLNPLNKINVIGKVVRSLLPDRWGSWFSFDSWKDPVEIGLRLSVLKIAFWVALFGLIIIIFLGGLAYAREHPIGTAWDALGQSFTR